MPNEPLVKLADQGEAAVLNYNVPEPTSYTGRNLVELVYPEEIFKHLPGTPIQFGQGPISAVDLEDFLLERTILASSRSLASNMGRRAAKSRRPGRGTRASLPALEAAATDLPLDQFDLNYNLDEAQKSIALNMYPVLVSTQSGGLGIEYAPVPTDPYPGIYLVETYRLSNFLGDYGAGRTVQTFSLLPGEKTHISISSYKDSTTTSTQASSIFDSYTEETADDFENSIQSENSSTEAQDKTTSWNVEAEASGNWGVASVGVSGGASGTTNTAREDFASNVNSATEKHAHTASAQRDITVNTSTEQTVSEGESTAIEREIENINVSCTLNFVIRQMNQEFISILHLVDVRVGFFNGFPETRMEVPLYDVDRLLEYCIIKPEDRTSVRKDVMFAIEQIKDFRGEIHFDPAKPGGPDNFVVLRKYVEQGGGTSQFHAVNRDKTSEFEGISVPGLIMSVRKHVLRTDGLVVEAMQGLSPALDDFSHDLQVEKGVEKQHDNRARELENVQMELALEILRDGDAGRARLYQQMFGEVEAEQAQEPAPEPAPVPA
jgi:hypothetical protein